jgi:hypothetical protein
MGFAIKTQSHGNVGRSGYHISNLSVQRELAKMMQGWCKDERTQSDATPTAIPTQMATVKLNSALQHLRGAIDGYVFKHYRYGIVVTRVPRMDRVTPSAAQLAQRERFRQAARFHRSVLADPALKKRYTTKAVKKGLPLSAVTLAEFMRRKPVVR